MKNNILFSLILLFSVGLSSCSGNKNNNDPIGDNKPIHEHNYIAEVIAPTCINDGFTIYKCDCGDEYIDDYVDSLGHDYIEREQNYKCSRCGKYEDDGFYFELLENTYQEAYEGRLGTYEIIGVSKEALENGRLTLPRKHYGIEVSGIRKGALYNLRRSLNELFIQENIKYIGSNLLSYDGQYNRPSDPLPLTKVSFDNECSNINISHNAFAFCENLEEVELPKGCITLMNNDDYVGNHFLFEGTPYYLNNKTEEKGIYYINDEFLTESDSSKINSDVYIKEGTKFISNYSFADNTNIKTIHLPKSVSYIGLSAFKNCVSLSKIIYDGTESDFDKIIIEETAFSNCNDIIVETI